jgi:plastocyanin
VTGVVEIWQYYGIAVFSPDEIEVPVGATVAWRWGDCLGGVCTGHNVTFADDPTQPTSSDTQLAGWHTRTFDEVGVYRYRCSHHQGETGLVRVE